MWSVTRQLRGDFSWLWNAGRQTTCRRTLDATLWALRGNAHGRTVLYETAGRRVRSCPMVHRAFPKISKSCRAKRALTLHYQPRFRRNQSTSTHNSAALRAAPRHACPPPWAPCCCCPSQHKQLLRPGPEYLSACLPACLPVQSFLGAAPANIHQLETLHRSDSEDIACSPAGRLTTFYLHFLSTTLYCGSRF